MCSSTIVKGSADIDEDIKLRLQGLVAACVGFGLVWWGAWEPLQAAEAGTQGWRPALNMAGLGVAFLFAGCAMLAGGARFPIRDPQRHRFTPLGWAVVTIISIVAVTGYVWFEGQFQMLANH